jgi:uncharacterized integral membrane protein
MKRALQWLVLLPVAVVAVAFAVANRQYVTISFNPFESPQPQGSGIGSGIQAPLFIVIILSVAAGVLIGGIFTWFAQGRHRRALRQTRGDLARLHDNAQSKS